MSNDTSEEKTEPGSEKKLQDSRRKGQAAKSQDMITALVVLACTVYLGFCLPNIAGRVTDLFYAVAQALDTPDTVFAQTWPVIVGKGLDVLVAATFPLFALIVLVVVVSNLIILRGFMFSADPIKPDFKRLDPVAGLKRLFSARHVVEFLKALVKVVALGSAFFLVYRHSLPFLFGAPVCGMRCVVVSFKVLFLPIAITAILAFLLTGLIDILLQQWLFARDMRMSHSEVKRERKDSEGAPEVRKERHRQRVSSQASSSARGEHMASVMIGASNDWIVGVRYVRGETKVPVLVHVVSPEQALQAWAQGNERGIPHAYAPGLSGEIARRCTLGEPLPERYFGAVAEILVKEGLI